LSVKYLIFIISLLFVPHLSIAQDSTHAGSVTKIIRQINIYGNHQTKSFVILSRLLIDTGTVFDSTKLQDAKERLKSTGLFTRVDIFPMEKKDGVYLYVIVYERFYFSLYDAGGELYGYKYGDKDIWWRLRLGLEKSNFRGRMETLRTSFSFWDWRSFYAYWQKPLLPSRFYTGIGASVDYYPDELFPVNHTDFSARFTLGRYFFKRSRAAFSIIPRYRHNKTVVNDSILDSDKKYLTFNTIRNDSTFYSTKAYEVFSTIGWITDKRNHFYDPSEGWLISADVRTNQLSAGKSVPYYQLSSESRFYHRGFFQGNKVAYRFGTVFRNTNAGPLNRLYYGGDGSVRGYYRQEIGGFIGSKFLPANNSILFSTEYRFTIYEFPEIRLPLLASFSSSLSSIKYRLDGQFILDYCRAGYDLDGLFSFKSDKVESGTGIGFGVRLQVPSLDHGISCDLVFGQDPRSGFGKIKFRSPMLHTYIDMPY
jgi:outer membrane protein assembly factor BamA